MKKNQIFISSLLTLFFMLNFCCSNKSLIKRKRVFYSDLYISNILDSKSAIKAGKYGSEIIINDSLNTFSIANMHDGITYSYNKNHILYPDSSIAYSYSIDKNELTLVSKNNRQKYIELTSNNPVFKYLFFGKYRLLYPKNGNNSIIKFHDNDKISGLLKYTDCFIPLDYDNPGMQFDLLYLVSKEEKNNFIWKFENDTLNLFEVVCIEMGEYEECYVIKTGKLEYSMVKIN